MTYAQKVMKIYRNIDKLKSEGKEGGSLAKGTYFEIRPYAFQRWSRTSAYYAVAFGTFSLISIGSNEKPFVADYSRLKLDENHGAEKTIEVIDMDKPYARKEQNKIFFDRFDEVYAEFEQTLKQYSLRNAVKKESKKVQKSSKLEKAKNRIYF